MRRMYRSGSRYSLWRWTDVTLDGALYLRRLHLIQTPWFAIMLHWILRPDPQPDLHDHPVTFLSLVLRGWYREWVPAPAWFPSAPLRVLRNQGSAVRYTVTGWWQRREVTRWRLFRPTDRHRICDVSPGGCVTLCFAGPVRRSWGFWTSGGFVEWREYGKDDRLPIFIGELDRVDPEDDARFHVLLLHGMFLMGIDEAEVARRFDMSRPSVNRWKVGRGAPHPSIRKHVYAFLRERAEQTLAKDFAGDGGKEKQ